MTPTVWRGDGGFADRRRRAGACDGGNKPDRETGRTLDGRARVLIVDDHALLRDAIRVALELAGNEIVGEAGDGYEAIQLTEELLPKVVVMDVTLPALDGIEATRRLFARGSEARVIILTMHSDPALVRRAVRAGASAYLTKTFSMPDVVEVVEKVARGDVVLSPNLAGSMLRELTAPAEIRRDLITKREAEALELVADGYSTREVASRLFVTDRTVRHDLSSIYGKLEARRRTEAVLDSVSWGIISRELSASTAG
jgi:two-component system, NarL family, response regulator DegU